eukprot:4346595-Prymnesium_polylepis.1
MAVRVSRPCGSRAVLQRGGCRWRCVLVGRRCRVRRARAGTGAWAADLQREREHRLLRQSVGVAPPEQLLQRQVAQLGHNVEVALVVAAAEEVQHVRVAQPREQRRLRAAVRHHRRRGDLLDCDQLARVHAAVHLRAAIGPRHAQRRRTQSRMRSRAR